MSNVEQILEFWFGNKNKADYGKPKKFWFTKDPKVDEAIKQQFAMDYELAKQGVLDSWKQSPRSCLALIILLDQIPRNIFRDQPQMYATDKQALSLAKFAVKHEFDQQLIPVKRWFIYLPFEHSENLDHQSQAVALFQTLSHDPDSADAIDYAIRHFDVIRKFGRFPHRNQILGRENTPEEAEFLKQPGSSF
ncbi:MAG: DUF924 family protein [Microcoleaceae cyanobacterium]